MRALVTGAAGFIGSALVDRLLAEGHTVDAVDDLSTGSLANLAEARSAAGHRLTFHQLDVRSSDLGALLERRRPEVVFHLAARPAARAPAVDPVADAEANLLGSLRVIDASRRAAASKVVVAVRGSRIYGGAGSELPFRDSQVARPSSPDGAAGRAVTEYLQVYRERYDLEFTALALGTVYGPRQDPGGPAGVAAALAGRLVDGRDASVSGDGRQTRDFVFVDDVVDAFARAAHKGSGLLLNVGTGVETSVNELYGVIATAAGVARAPARLPARPGELRRCALDPARAALHLGWEPWTSLPEGIAATLAWLRARGR